MRDESRRLAAKLHQVVAYGTCFPTREEGRMGPNPFSSISGGH